MATEKLSDFAARGSLLTTELDALANGSYSAAGTALDNATNNDRFAIAELTVDFVSAPTDYSVCELFGVVAPDASNYADGGGSARPAQELYLGSFQLQAVTSAQRVVTAPFELLPCLTKLVLRNGSGQAFPASGSIVKLFTFNREIG